MKLLPASLDAERGVIGSIMLRPADALALCAELCVIPEYFSWPAHGTIFATLAEMWDARKPVDAVTLMTQLEDTKQLDHCGGMSYVSELCGCQPTAAHLRRYLEILREKWQLREVIRIGTDAVTAAYEMQDQPDQVIEDFESGALSVRARCEHNEAPPPRAGVMAAITSIQETYERRGQPIGLSTGFHQFDLMTEGLRKSELMVIAARPSMGKTAFAMNMAEHIAVELGKPVGVFSLEMSQGQLWQRLLCSRARVNLANVRNGYLTERDFPAITVAASKFSECGMYIDDSSALTIQALRGKARRMKQRYGTEVFFVDYLQLLRSGSKRGAENRQLEISEISQGLKSLSKELDCPVVALAQLNRQVEQRSGASKLRPRLSDLRESGSIEQDADTIGFLVREEYYAETEAKKEELAGQATLIVAKQRNGPTGDVPLTFLKQFTRFVDRAEQPA